MNRKLLRIIALLFFLVLGWVLGYIRVPYIELQYSFWVGFIGGVTLLFALWILMWPKKEAKVERKKNSTIVSILIIGILGIAAVLQGKNNALRNEVNEQSETLAIQQRTIDSLQQGHVMTLMKAVLNKVEDEVESSPNRAISALSHEQLVNLNRYFKPYVSHNTDTGVVYFSPERGQLLLSLLSLRMNDTSFQKIKEQVSFAYAYVPDAELVNFDLSGANLYQSYWVGSKLLACDLSNTNLQFAILEGVDLGGTNLNQADFKRAKMKWVQLDSASLIEANLDGADISNADLTGANLEGAHLHWTNLQASILSNSNMAETDMSGVDFTKADLQNSSLENGIIKRTKLQDANMKDVQIDSSWMSSLKTASFQNEGLEQLEQNYVVESDSLTIDSTVLYFLRADVTDN